MKVVLVALCLFFSLCFGQTWKTYSFDGGLTYLTLNPTNGWLVFGPLDLSNDLQQFWFDTSAGQGFIYPKYSFATTPAASRLVFDVSGGAANAQVIAFKKKATSNTNQKWTNQANGSIKSGISGGFYLTKFNHPQKGWILTVSTTQTPITVADPLPPCNPTCQNGGTCTVGQVCSCTSQWSGASCTTPVCTSACQNGGTCSAPNTCTCPAGYTGATCQTPVCTPTCSNGGTCTAPNTCSCTTGWSGATCTTPVCAPTCSNGGTCTAPNTCSCASGWSGATCTTAVCAPTCQNGGTCTTPNTCSCPAGYTGATCGTATCAPTCQNGGTCTAPNTCSCAVGYTGTTCATPVCTTPCQNGGTCTAPNICTCPAGYTGAACSSRLVTRPITCTSWGDPHIIQFESNQNLQFPGIQKAGTFKLAVFGTTQVAAEHTGYVYNPAAYVNKKVSIKQGTDLIVVEGTTLKVNGATISLNAGNTFVVSPFSDVYRESTNAYRVNVPNGYIRAINQGTYIDIYVVVTGGAWPAGGICSDTPGGAKKRDLRTLTLDEFIESWRIQLYGDDPFGYPTFEAWRAANPLTYPTNNGSFSTNDPVLLANINALCAPLQSSQLVTDCSPFVNPATFYQSCIMDCIASGDLAFAGTSIDAYAHACGFRATVPITTPTSGQNSIAYGPGVAQYVQKSTATTFLIRAKDALGNNVTTGGAAFQITSTGPALLTFSGPTSLNNGLYQVGYTANTDGKYNISVKYQGINHITNSPFTVQVGDITASALYSFVMSVPVSPLFAEENYSFFIHAQNGFNLPRTSGGDVFVVSFTTAAAATVVDNQDGTYEVIFHVNEYGAQFMVNVKLGGADIVGSPFALATQEFK